MASEADNPFTGLFVVDEENPNYITYEDVAVLLDNTPEATITFTSKFLKTAGVMIDQAKGSLQEVSHEERQQRLSKLSIELGQYVDALLQLGLDIELQTTEEGGYFFTTSKIAGKAAPHGYESGSNKISGEVGEIDFIERIEVASGLTLPETEHAARYDDVPSIVLRGGLYKYIVPLDGVKTVAPKRQIIINSNKKT